MKYVGLDLGFGNIKIRDERGSTVHASHMKPAGSIYQDDDAVKNQYRRVEFGGFKYCVGLDAAMSNKSSGSLDPERILGGVEIQAAIYAAIGAHFENYPRWKDREGLTVYAGIPALLLDGEKKKARSVSLVKDWLERKHTWIQDGEEISVDIANVVVRSQATGAINDMAYTLDGRQTKDVQFLDAGFGLISIGYNTIELSGGIAGRPLIDMIRSERYGVSDMLSYYEGTKSDTLSMLDWKLRTNRLNGSLAGAVSQWQTKIVGYIFGQWDKLVDQVERVILVGGGAQYAEPALRSRFGDKLWLPDDPIISIARGLYKRAVADGKKG